MKKLYLAALVLFLAGCQPEDPVYQGYVEGDYLMIAPTTAGVLDALTVTRGQGVKQGARLFALDLTTLKAALASAAAEEAQAKAALEAAQNEYHRAVLLNPTGATSQADLDEKKAAFHAAESTIAMAQQKQIQIQKQLSEAAPTAPAAGYIEETYYRPGEYVAAGSAVVRLLPPENIKIRFFVPQARVPQLAAGQTLSLSCDGCTAPIPAKITFISSQSEYTPPVIYSVGSRDKLVFMIEAKPEQFSPQLRPGLPLDIALRAP